MNDFSQISSSSSSESEDSSSSSLSSESSSSEEDDDEGEKSETQHRVDPAEQIHLTQKGNKFLKKNLKNRNVIRIIYSCSYYISDIIKDDS